MPIPVLMANHEATMVVDFSPLQWTCSISPSPVLQLLELGGYWETLESQFIILNGKIINCYTFYGNEPAIYNCQELIERDLTWKDHELKVQSTEETLYSFNRTAYLYRDGEDDLYFCTEGREGCAKLVPDIIDEFP